MEVFGLTNLEPVLREKIIAKLDFNSYFHMQQTCHGMHDFIRKSKNISVHWDEKRYMFFNYTFLCNCCVTINHSKICCSWDSPPSLKFGKSGDSCKLQFIGVTIDKSRVDHYMDIADFYGTRLPSLTVSNEAKDCGRVCNFLRKFQVTVEDILFNCEWTREETGTFLKIVKPRKISLNSERSDRYEALFQSKSIEAVTVELDIEGDLEASIPKFIRTFHAVEIHINKGGTCFNLLRTCLKILQSNPWPNLRYFSCSVYETRGMVRKSIADLKALFQGYNLTVRKDRMEHKIFTVEVPQHFFAASNCEIALSEDFVSLYCGMRYE